MEYVPKTTDRKSLYWSLGLGAGVWIVASPIDVAPWTWIPAWWRVVAGLVLVSLLLSIPARNYATAVFRKKSDTNDTPLRFISAASLMLIIASLVGLYPLLGSPETLMTPAIQLHSAAFLICFDMVIRTLLLRNWTVRQQRAKESLGLSRSMLERIKAAEEAIPPLVNKLKLLTPKLFIALALFSGLTLLLWLLVTGSISQSLIQAATVLVICSPWIWYFAVPAAFNIGLQTAARNQILISSGSTVEHAAKISAIVFGKRGTLTQGSPHVTDIIPCSGIDEEELLLWAASAEHDSRHPFGQAIVAEAAAQAIPLEPPERFTEMSGRGVECVIDGQAVRFGKPTFFENRKLPSYLADRIEVLAQEGKTPFICCRGDQFLGIIAASEEIRHEAAAAIENIRALGLQTILMTGDDRMMSESIAEGLHIDRVVAEVLPENKPIEINKLRREGFQIGMVGIYPDDRESFNESELSIALERGKGPELPPTDVILLEDKLGHIVSFFDMSNRILRIARQDSGLGLVYHIVMPIFAAGLLVPFGYGALSPVAAALWSGGALLVALLNDKRVDALN